MDWQPDSRREKRLRWSVRNKDRQTPRNRRTARQQMWSVRDKDRQTPRNR